MNSENRKPGVPESGVDPLLQDLRKLNAELKVLAEYQILLERRISRVFLRLESRIRKGEKE
jgi:hypothetical protein